MEFRAYLQVVSLEVVASVSGARKAAAAVFMDGSLHYIYIYTVIVHEQRGEELRTDRVPCEASVSPPVNPPGSRASHSCAYAGAPMTRRCWKHSRQYTGRH